MNYHSHATRPGVRLCHGGVLFEDWLHHEYFSYAGNVHGGGRREGASVYRCIRAQGRQQKYSKRRKSTEDTVLKKVPQGSFAYLRIRAEPYKNTALATFTDFR